MCRGWGQILVSLDVLTAGQLHVVAHRCVYRGKCVALDLCKALAYLHTRRTKVVHFDLKAANILVTADGRAKLADVGECTWLGFRVP